MSRSLRVLAIALVVGLAGACAEHPSGDDGHAAAPAEAHDAAHADLRFDYPVPAGHLPWTPDAPLLEGMARVRAALGGLEADAAPGPAAVRAAAGEVDDAIDYMFANCELDPEPDIALHAVLARLMAGSRQLHADPGDLAPVADMHAALANYARLFDDPGVSLTHQD